MSCMHVEAKNQLFEFIDRGNRSLQILHSFRWRPPTVRKFVYVCWHIAWKHTESECMHQYGRVDTCCLAHHISGLAEPHITANPVSLATSLLWARIPVTEDQNNVKIHTDDATHRENIHETVYRTRKSVTYQWHKCLCILQTMFRKCPLVSPNFHRK